MSVAEQLKHLARNPLSILCRKKAIEHNSESTPLKRCLSVWDLTLLEIGCMIGSGIFMVVGSSIQEKAGPGVILSFLVAGIPSFISALCYAEFGARVPKAGSTYDYVYVTLGEFWAAMVGWYFVSSSLFWAAAGSIAWSSYFDTLLDNRIRNWTLENVGSFKTPYLSPYPDFLACLIVLIFSAIIATGAKISAWINNVFSLIKLGAMVFIVGYGFSLANFDNWTNEKEGGFLPFGFGGVMAAAPSCLFAYVGFEAATTAGEEAKNPRKSIVLAIGFAFIIVITAYILMCASLTLMLPYKEISTTSSFADAFDQRGSPWAKYIVAVGALSALTTALFGTMFYIPRYVYAVSSDGLIFQWLGKVNQRTGVPVLAIGIYAALSVVVILLFDLDALVEFLSMGSLLCYTLVPASVIVLKYRPRNSRIDPMVGRLKQKYRLRILETAFGRLQPGGAVIVLSSIQAVVMVIGAAIIARVDWNDHTQFYVFGIVLALLAMVLVLVQLVMLAFEQNGDEDLWFKIPLVPFLPSISMFINILMVLYLEPLTWLRFGVYMMIGIIVYFLYGVHHSAHKSDDLEKATLAASEAELDETYF